MRTRNLMVLLLAIGSYSQGCSSQFTYEDFCLDRYGTDYDEQTCRREYDAFLDERRGNLDQGGERLEPENTEDLNSPY